MGRCSKLFLFVALAGVALYAPRASAQGEAQAQRRIKPTKKPRNKPPSSAPSATKTYTRNSTLNTRNGSTKTCLHHLSRRAQRLPSPFRPTKNANSSSSSSGSAAIRILIPPKIRSRKSITAGSPTPTSITLLAFPAGKPTAAVFTSCGDPPDEVQSNPSGGSYQPPGHGRRRRNFHLPV